MSVYVGSFLLIYIIGFFCKRAKSNSEESRNRKTKFFLVFAWIVLSAIEGLRAYTVGTDTPFYVRTFQVLARQRYEIGYWTLMRLVRYITDNPTVLLTVCALLTNGLFMISIYKLSDDCYMSVFSFITLMFYFVSFNAVRQSIAISMVVIAYYFIKAERLKSFILMVILATLFHSSAIVGLLYLPIYFIRDKEFPKRRGIQQDFIELIITWAIILAGYLLFERIISIFSRALPVYSHYLTSEYATATGGFQRPLVYMAIYICVVLFTEEFSAEKRMITIPLSIAVMFAFMHFKISAISRFMWYFDIISIFAIPYLFNNLRLRGKINPLFRLAVIAILVAFMFYNLRAGYMRVTDFKFFWQ